MFHLGTPAWEIVARTFVVYLLVLLGVKLLGKKEMGQMSAPDLVLVLLLANAVQNAMVGQDSSLSGGLLAAGLLLLLNRVLNALTLRNSRLEQWVEGTPTLLVHDGVLIAAHARREQVTLAEIEMAMREHGLDDMKSVKSAVLEPDGSISIIPAGVTTLTSKHKVKRIKHHKNS
jgi:uncharacterized membrane protein YcaP (DUF421 family)